MIHLLYIIKQLRNFDFCNALQYVLIQVLAPFYPSFSSTLLVRAEVRFREITLLCRGAGTCRSLRTFHKSRKSVVKFFFFEKHLLLCLFFPLLWLVIVIDDNFGWQISCTNLGLCLHSLTFRLVLKLSTWECFRFGEHLWKHLCLCTECAFLAVSKIYFTIIVWVLG